MICVRVPCVFQQRPQLCFVPEQAPFLSKLQRCSIAYRSGVLAGPRAITEAMMSKLMMTILATAMIHAPPLALGAKVAEDIRTQKKGTDPHYPKNRLRSRNRYAPAA